MVDDLERDYQNFPRDLRTSATNVWKKNREKRSRNWFSIYIYSLFIVAKLVAGMRKENGERMVGDVVNGGTTH